MFTLEEDMKLIELVKQYPTLYDSRHVHYKNIVKRCGIWDKIADQMGKTVPECKNRWRNTKDTYYRTRKKICNDGVQSNWHYYKYLRFLDDLKYESRSRLIKNENEDQQSDNQQSAESQNESEHSASVEVEVDYFNNESNQAVAFMNEITTNDDLEKPRTRIKRKFKDMLKHKKKMKILERTERSEDENESFFKSIEISVRKLPRNLRVRARMDIHNIVFKYELQALEQSKE